MNIFVGNLPWTATEDDLQREFAAHGQVESATIIKDRVTNKSRGFGFVIMNNEAEAKAAIQALNGKDFGGRPLTVNEAKPRTDDGYRGGGGGGRRDRY
jgi:RNA recognition motif-containing protein